MKRIYLFCSAGMSTSMLAAKMQEVAKANNLPVEVKAFSHSQIEQIVNEFNPDVILLGPQVKHLYKETADKYDASIPVAVIDADDYGRMRGDKVLKSALQLLKERRA